MYIYPEINPIALQIGPIKIYWYGVMYLIGFLSAWLLGNFRAKASWNNWSKEEVGDLIFYGALGVVIGGRVGYMLFYALPDFIANPLLLFKVWQGGMSFHGGLLGVCIAEWLFSRRVQKSFLTVMDFAAPLVPIGLAAGRLGNFINGELWGRVTDVPWGMIYPHAGPLPRHPSELYEFFLEGVFLFIILWWFSSKPRARGAVSGLFSLLYGCARFVAEFFRQPDQQIGFVAFGWMTKGQLLSLPMILVGIGLLWWAFTREE